MVQVSQYLLGGKILLHMINKKHFYLAAVLLNSILLLQVSVFMVPVEITLQIIPRTVPYRWLLIPESSNLLKLMKYLYYKIWNFTTRVQIEYVVI